MIGTLSTEIHGRVYQNACPLKYHWSSEDWHLCFVDSCCHCVGFHQQRMGRFEGNLPVPGDSAEGSYVWGWTGHLKRQSSSVADQNVLIEARWKQLLDQKEQKKPEIQHSVYAWKFEIAAVAAAMVAVGMLGVPQLHSQAHATDTTNQ